MRILLCHLRVFYYRNAGKFFRPDQPAWFRIHLTGTLAMLAADTAVDLMECALYLLVSTLATVRAALIHRDIVWDETFLCGLVWLLNS